MPEPQVKKPPLSGKQKAAGGGGLAIAIAAILGAVYADEGGYVNHPSDPGGATNYGVTERVARQAGYRGSMREFPMHCSESKQICADAIYVRDYIERPGYLPLIPIEPAVADELVNTTVNMGPGRPGKWFQQSLNELGGSRLAVDGKIGPASIAAYRGLQQQRGKAPACVAMLDRLDTKQRAEYDRLVSRNSSLKAFYRGWIKRRIGNVNRADCGKGWA
jgi:lysozyme family protein